MKIDPVRTIRIESPQISVKHKPYTANMLKPLYKYFIATVFLITLIFSSTINDFITLFSFDGDPEIIEIASNSGFNLKGMALFLRNNPEMVDANRLQEYCPTEDNAIEYGCYKQALNKIYLLQVEDAPYNNIEYSTAAHELLHVIWGGLGSAEQLKLKAALDEILAKDHQVALDIKNTLSEYPNDDRIQSHEKHSIIGSTVSDNFLNPTLTMHFNKFFSDRSLTINAESKFNDFNYNTLRSIEEATKELDFQLQELNLYKSQWLDPIERYMEQNLYYGDIYKYNQNVKAYENNRKIYNANVDKYNSQLRNYNKNLETYNKFWESISPDKKVTSELQTVNSQ